MSRTTAAGLALALSSSIACNYGLPAGTPDAGPNDAGSNDAGSNDAGSSDAGSNDAGSNDAGQSDAGADAGTDAGQNDAGQADGGPWINVTANLAGIGSECGNLSLLSSRPDKDQVIAGIAQRGLWALQNGADTWVHLGTGAGSATITNRMSAVIYDPDHPNTYWESGIYNGGGVYRTDDSGVTFTQLGSVTHSDLVSIDLSDSLRKTLLAGTHEQPGILRRSTDSGANWIDIGANIPAGAGYSAFPLVVDSMNFLLGTYNSAGAGVFRSATGGTSWTQVYAGGVFGHPLAASDGSYYWILDGGNGLIRSADKGATWTKMIGSGTLGANETGVLELPDGRLATLGQTHVIISTDHGAHWTTVGQALPYSPVGLVYSKFRKSFFIWHFDCSSFDPTGDPVLADAIERLAFDYTTE